MHDLSHRSADPDRPRPSVSWQRQSTVAIAIFAVSLILLWIGMDRFAFNIYDEGVIVYGAERVLQGDVPYRDFWGVYPPGQFWSVAALFKLFGSSILVERFWDMSLRAGIALMSYLIAARLASVRCALVVWTLSLAWLWAIGYPGYPMIPALLLTLLSSWFFISFLASSSSRKDLFAAGIFVGLTVAFRHDVGFQIFVAEVVTLISLAVIGRSARSRAVETRSTLLSDGLMLGGGIAVTLVPLLIYLVATVPMHDLLDQLIIFPATVYPVVRSVPYPSIFDTPPVEVFPYYFHFIVLALAGIYLYRARSKKFQESNLDLWKAVLFLFWLIGLMFLKSLVRPDYPHLIHVFVPSVLLAAVLFSTQHNDARVHGEKLVLLIALFGMAVYPAVTARAALVRYIVMLQDPSKVPHPSGLSRAGGLAIPKDQAAALDYVREHVRPGAKIFVGAGRHDTVLLNDVMFYFLAERGSATRYHELHPGLATTLSAQQTIVDDLLHNHVQYVVLYLGFDDHSEPNRRALSTHVEKLDAFLQERYRTVFESGYYKVLELRD